MMMKNYNLKPWALLIAALVLLCATSCAEEEVDVPDEVKPYLLPESHPDNESAMKNLFFQEPFRNLNGEMVQLRDIAGTPMVLIMFPSFLTDDGRSSMLGIEAMQRSYGERMQAVFIPVEDKATVEPVLMQDPGGMLFLFRASDEGNLSLIDKYEEFFWDPDIIAADFPFDAPAAHHTSPFYWVVDAEGNIREKLIDYSDARGVGLEELAEVLDALIGPSDTGQLEN